MKVVEIREAFGFENLAVVDRPAPTPGHGQVLLRARATSLNYRDLMTIRGAYNPRQPLPLIPLSDGVGEVEAVGEGVTRVKVGDRVAGIFAQGWLSGSPTRERLQRTTLGGPLDGMLAERVVLHEDGVVHVPEHLTDEEAACLPCAAVTAWSALVRHGNVKAGDTVLTLGTGGVSIFALQFAKLLGAEVIVTSSSDEKLDKVKTIGADHGINYRTTPKWSETVREITNGTGVDHVIELGGVGTLEQSMRAVRMGGQISLIGVLTGIEAPLNVTPLLMQEVRLQGIMVGPRDAFESMNRAIAYHKLRPIVDRVFEMEETRAACEYMAGGNHIGKVCIRTAP
ncbi:MAG: NADPH:quinone oxidoreductase [Candidatus Hydrogenedentota bacterium]